MQLTPVAGAGDQRGVSVRASLLPGCPLFMGLLRGAGLAGLGAVPHRAGRAGGGCPSADRRAVPGKPGEDGRAVAGEGARRNLEQLLSVDLLELRSATA
jgi:hypothetical protein